MGPGSDAPVPLHVLGWMFLLSETPATPFQFTGGVTLDHGVDRARLRDAVDAASAALPLFRYRLAPGWRDVAWVPGPSGPRIEPDLRRLGRRMRLEREPPARVYARGADLLIEVHHALTDGFGLLSFLNHVLARYLGQRAPRQPALPLATDDPLARILGAAGEVGPPPRPSSAPYRLAAQPRARRRWSLTWTLERAPLEQVARELATTPHDLLAALYLQALADHARWPGRPLELNAFLPHNVRALFGERSAFNCCGGALLPLAVRRDQPLEDLLAVFRAARTPQLEAGYQLRVLAGLRAAFASPTFRAAPLALKRTAARFVSRAFSERFQTEMLSYFGEQPFPARIARHLRRGFGIPAVKHTRWASFGFGGVSDTWCATFALRTSSRALPEAFRRRLLALDAGLVREPALVLP